uniref:Putative secreted protein n=1 Tax=Anopheles marajoara TaxID=58244 RepID=A0A2M4CDE0_9DIPT
MCSAIARPLSRFKGCLPGVLGGGSNGVHAACLPGTRKHPNERDRAMQLTTKWRKQLNLINNLASLPWPSGEND